MSVNPAGSSSRAAQASAEPQLARNDQMGQVEFLQLLATQLRYQDPLQPMDDRDFAAQLAQFSSLEKISEQTELTKMAYDLSLVSLEVIAEQAKWSKMTYGLGLVGHTVSYLTDDGTTATGVVTALKMVDGKPMLSIGEAEVPVDQVTQATKSE